MSKKILRIISVVLAVLLAGIVAVPTPIDAAASAKDVEQQIIRTYKQARSYYGRYSFDGYCAALVGAQLYLLGITTTVVSCNGNEEYDAYCGQTVTSGGYHVRAYPAGSYTLLEALEEITAGGTRDVYNILVGFQETRSSLGRYYGHACMIHAILGGMVYFVESYDVILNGRYYTEGTPIVCTIAEFAEYYEKTTVSFDGVIHFTEQGYADFCRIYPADLVVTASGGTMRSQPCEAKIDSGSTSIRTLADGEELQVTGLYLNTEGEYWYQIAQEGFVRASHTILKGLRFDDVTVTDPSAPTVLRQGKGYQVEGTIQSGYNSIYTVRAQVYRLEDEGQTQVISATETVQSKYYDLSGSDIARDLTFRKLSAGHYRYDLAAIVGNHYVQGGRLQVGWETVALWSSEFQVVEESGSSGILSFDACGGTAPLDQTAVTVGACVTTLPAARREGFVFLGWYTEEQGGTRVDDGLMPEGDMTLYAHWIGEDALYEGWQDRGKCLYYYSDGLTTMGCIEIDGTLYYFSSMDTPGQDRIMWTAAGTV